MALSVLLGGGGSPEPLLELALQLVLAALFGWWLLRDHEGLARVPRLVWWIGGLIAGLHLAQLVPLPPALWHAMPGRDGQIAALELVGADADWRTLTLSPARTLASLLAALSALGCLTITASLPDRSRWVLLAVTAAAGAATLLVGAAQLSGGSGSWLRFFDTESPWLNGFQANHNSTADLILIAMLAMAALGRRALDRGLARPSLVQAALTLSAVDAVMVLGLFLTGSRAGIGLLPVMLIFQYLILLPDTRIRWARLLGSLGGVLAFGGLAFVLLRENRAVQQVLQRFSLEGEFRPELWRDSLYALGQYWPAGSGQGTFTPVLIAVERLEVVDPTLPNRAHNDFLELAIGAGLPGVLVLAAVAAILLAATVRKLREPGGEARAQAMFAIGTLTIAALHSLVDYPMRSMALAGLVAMAAGLLFTPQAPGSGQAEEPQA
ncbi:MAG: O-antigen ligase family protein [Novosphingobium sp.]